MAPVLLRVRTPARMLRVTVDSSASVADVRAAIAAELGHASVGAFRLSLAPSYADALRDSSRIAALGLGEGTLLFSDAPSAAVKPAAAGAGAGAGAPSSASSSATAAAPSPPRVLSAKCAHGPHGACQHCASVTQADIDRLRAPALNAAAAWNERHAARSSKAEDLSGENLEWLCRHRPDAMCVNCAPLRKGEKVELEMLCLHGPDGRCINCLPPDAAVEDQKFISYEQWRERRFLGCEHVFGAVCVNCVPPADVSYKLKAGCAKHKPWPGGLCSDCAPPAVDLRLQPYRHVDYVQLAAHGEVAAFVRLCDANAAAGLQRAAFMYGRVVPDATYKGGQRVIVDALYEPPQKWDPASGAIKLTADARAGDVAAVAAALGLARVGWLFMKARALAPGEPTLAPRELVAMAMLQNAHPRTAPLLLQPRAAGPRIAYPPAGSQFVTLVLRKEAHGGIEPRGYAASDQMCALARDGVLAPPAVGDKALRVREPKPGEPPVPEVVVVSRDRGRRRDTTFEVEIGLVTLEVGGATAGTPPRLRHTTFPVENRGDFGVQQRPSDVARHLAAFRSEPLHHRCSDFHLLLYLATLMDTASAVLLAQAVAADTPVPDGLQLMLEAIG